MKTIILTLVGCTVVLCAVAFAAEPIDQPKAQSNPPSIYMAPVPEELAKKIADATEEVRKLNPLSEEQVLELKAQVEKVKFGAERENSYVEYIRSLDFGCLPVFAELLTSQDEIIRLNTLTSFICFVKPPELLRNEKISETYPKYESLMILLCRRSYLNKSDKVRLSSIKRLGDLSFQAMRRLGGGIELPAGAKEALMQARQDPIPRIALWADIRLSQHVLLIPELDQEEEMRRWEEVMKWEKEHGMERAFDSVW